MMAMLEGKVVVPFGPARLSSAWLSRALLPIPDVWIRSVPDLLEKEKFYFLMDLPMFFVGQET